MKTAFTKMMTHVPLNGSLAIWQRGSRLSGVEGKKF
jgi:hypothetical protein